MSMNRRTFLAKSAGASLVMGLGVVLPGCSKEEVATDIASGGASVSFSNMNVDIAASGDMGYTLADAVVTVDGPDGQPIEDKIRDFHLWKKQDGQWKIAIDIWNSENPMSGAATSASPLEGAWVVTSLHQLLRFDGNRTRAAEALGISVRTLRNKIRAYDLR